MYMSLEHTLLCVELAARALQGADVETALAKHDCRELGCSTILDAAMHPTTAGEMRRLHHQALERVKAAGFASLTDEPLLRFVAQYEREHGLRLQDLHRASAICADDYVPIMDDILRVRVRTTGTLPLPW